MEFVLREKMLPAPVNGGFAMDGYWIWCGSVAKGEDGYYHMFASRWPKTIAMHPGWLLQSEVVRAVAERPEGPYIYQETVLPARGAQYWDGRMTHNPHITRQNGKWVLYYTGSTHPFAEPAPGETVANEDPRVIAARTNKRIGVAVADRLCGPWKRFLQPVLSVRSDHRDNLLTSNPAPCVEESGVYMIYKYRSYIEPPYTGLLHGKMQLHAARAENFMGPYERVAGETILPEGVELEDPFVWKQNGFYHMIAKDMHGNVCGEKYGGIYARSEDGERWKMKENYCAYSRRVLWDNGEIKLMGNLERPFILFEENKPRCIFFATSDGTDSFRDATRTWNMAIPLKE